MSDKTLDKPGLESQDFHAEGMATAGAPAIEDVRPARANPARKIALFVIAIMVALGAWYAASDRLVPYSSRGSVSAYLALIAPRVSGQITEVYVHDNVVVNGGDPLFQIDDRPFRIAVRRAEANLAQATQSIDASSASPVASQASVAQARATLENVQSAASRTLALVERGISSNAQRDAAEADVRTAEAQFGSAEANLRSAEAQLGERGQNNPQIQLAQLELEQAQYDPLSTKVVAPGRGVLTNVRLTPGQFVSAGGSALTFLDAQGAWISADFRENQLANVQRGDRVGLVFDAVPGTVFAGTVDSIAWGIDPGRTTAGGLLQNQPETRWFEPARRMPVRIELDGGVEAWPRAARAGGMVSAVIYTEADAGPLASVSGTLLRLQSYLSYLY
jgi:multidrug resistance efflux pump